MKILVIDDEQDLRMLVTYFLQKEGYQVETAENGLEGFEKTKSWHPDLIVSDVQMPVCNGHGLLSRLEALAPPPVPVLFMSGYPGKENVDYSQTKNLKGFLAKPFTPKELLDTVASVFKGTPYSPKTI
ncbi:MAG: response regulator [Bdellovibrio sp.]|uniref:response regulator n=1 Tax=Bdellovibrio sp. TaxID=28201 RepID=UPI0039E6881A|nr:response regulator [Bdellovibrio sp.]